MLEHSVRFISLMGAHAVATAALVTAEADTTVCVVAVVAVVLLIIKLRECCWARGRTGAPSGRAITLPSGAVVFIRDGTR